MGRERRISPMLQVGVLAVASLLEVTANFAASDVRSGAVRTLVRFALPAVLLLVVGNVLVLPAGANADGQAGVDSGRAPYPGRTGRVLGAGRRDVLRPRGSDR